MFYRMRTGCPWRDLPEYFGYWNTIFQQFNRWSLNHKWMNIFNALVIDPDLEWEFVDGSIVKAHQHSVGAATNKNEAQYTVADKGYDSEELRQLIDSLLNIKCINWFIMKCTMIF